MVSLKSVATNCLGISGSFSVNRDVFGYIFRDGSGRLFGALGGNDTLPDTGQPTTRSLRRQLEGMQGNSINLSIFLVGHEDDFSGVVSLADVTRVQYAIQVARDIYRQAGLGIRRIYWRRIGVAEAGNYTIITDRPEAEDLTDDFSGPNDGIDVFWVQQILNAGGWCNTDGPCDKDAKDEMTGVVIELSNGSRFTGILLGHEVGHYMKLSHANSITNLMGVDSNNDGIGELNNNSTAISNSQAALMLTHCAVKGAC